jgi:myo-inositol catabolism protein IolS
MESGVKIAVNQLVFNLLTRAIEMEILPFCKEQGIQVIAYSPLLQGLLTGRWLKTEDIPEYRSRTRHFNSATNAKSRHGEAGQEEILFKTLVNLN